MKDHPILIGVDGGGTGCRAILSRQDGRGTSEMRGGPANVSDFDGACARLIATIRALLQQAGVTPADHGLVVAHFGLAGVTGPDMAARTRAALDADLAFRRITVTGDGVTMVAGALGGAEGAVAALGTGSFIGRCHGGRVTTIGGRGFLLGDQASGGWLGKRLLQEVMLAADGLRPHSDLSRAVLARHGDDIARIIAFAIAARPADIAELGPDVMDAADQGDPLAQALIGEGVAYVTAGLAAIGWRAGDALCLTGGLGARYGRYLPPDLAASLAAVRGTALDGALQLASEAAR